MFYNIFHNLYIYIYIFTLADHLYRIIYILRMQKGAILDTVAQLMILGIKFLKQIISKLAGGAFKVSWLNRLFHRIFWTYLACHASHGNSSTIYMKYSIFVSLLLKSIHTIAFPVCSFILSKRWAYIYIYIYYEL